MADLAQQRTYLYLLYNQIIYDPIHATYYNILTLNKNPEGLLKTYTKLTSLTKPSTRDLITTECAFVIKNDLINNNLSNSNLSYSNFLTLDDLNEFTEFLINNNYVITDTTYNNNNNTKKIIYSFKITL